jgi:amidase
MQPNLVWNIEQGLSLGALQVGQAEVARGVLWRRTLSFFEGYDLLLTPAAGTVPFPVEVVSPLEVAGRRMGNYVEWLGITYAITLTGLPAIVVPCGHTTQGLPVGLQIVGRRLAEASILRAAAAFEQVRPWDHQRPRLSSA